MGSEIIAAVGVGIVTLLQGIILYIHSNVKQHSRDEQKTHTIEHDKMEDRCSKHNSTTGHLSERLSRLETDMAQVKDKASSATESYQRLSMRLEDIARNMITKEDLWLFKQILSTKNVDPKNDGF